MSGALNPSNSVNRFHGAPATAATFATPDCGSSAAAAAAAAAASFLELTNTAAAVAAAADFTYDFSLSGFRPPPPAHSSANFGVSYFGSEAADNYASLAWEAQTAFTSPYQGQPPFNPVSCDFGPFGLAGGPCTGGRISSMAVSRFGAQVRGSGCGSGSGSSGGSITTNGGLGQSPGSKSKTRRRVATIAQRRAANIRERRRMFNLNSAFDKLRKKVPTFAYEKRLSRIETLRLAIMYIAFMTDVIRGKDSDSHPPHESHHMSLATAPYTPVSGHALTDGRLWAPSHGPSTISDGPLPRSDRLSHLCSRQV